MEESLQSTHEDGIASQVQEEESGIASQLQEEESGIASQVQEEEIHSPSLKGGFLFDFFSGLVGDGDAASANQSANSVLNNISAVMTTLSPFLGGQVQLVEIARSAVSFTMRGSPLETTVQTVLMSAEGAAMFVKVAGHVPAVSSAGATLSAKVASVLTASWGIAADFAATLAAAATSTVAGVLGVASVGIILGLAIYHRKAILSYIFDTKGDIIIPDALTRILAQLGIRMTRDVMNIVRNLIVLKHERMEAATPEFIAEAKKLFSHSEYAQELLAEGMVNYEALYTFANAGVQALPVYDASALQKAAPLLQRMKEKTRAVEESMAAFHAKLNEFIAVETSMKNDEEFAKYGELAYTRDHRFTSASSTVEQEITRENDAFIDVRTTYGELLAFAHAAPPGLAKEKKSLVKEAHDIFVRLNEKHEAFTTEHRKMFVPKTSIGFGRGAEFLFNLTRGKVEEALREIKTETQAALGVVRGTDAQQKHLIKDCGALYCSDVPRTSEEIVVKSIVKCHTMFQRLISGLNYMEDSGVHISKNPQHPYFAKYATVWEQFMRSKQEAVLLIEELHKARYAMPNKTGIPLPGDLFPINTIVLEDIGAVMSSTVSDAEKAAAMAIVKQKADELAAAKKAREDAEAAAAAAEAASKKAEEQARQDAASQAKADAAAAAAAAAERKKQAAEAARKAEEAARAAATQASAQPIPLTRNEAVKQGLKTTAASLGSATSLGGALDQAATQNFPPPNPPKDAAGGGGGASAGGGGATATAAAGTSWWQGIGDWWSSTANWFSDGLRSLGLAEDKDGKYGKLVLGALIVSAASVGVYTLWKEYYGNKPLTWENISKVLITDPAKGSRLFREFIKGGDANICAVMQSVKTEEEFQRLLYVHDVKISHAVINRAAQKCELGMGQRIAKDAAREYIGDTKRLRKTFAEVEGEGQGQEQAKAQAQPLVYIPPTRKG